MPTVTIEVGNGEGGLHPLEVIVDTGFNGDLTLPTSLVRRLRLTHTGGSFARLADGAEVETRNYSGVVSWHGKLVDVSVIETGGDALLGMALMLDSKITVISRPGGAVTIEEE